MSSKFTSQMFVLTLIVSTLLVTSILACSTPEQGSSNTTSSTIDSTIMDRHFSVGIISMPPDKELFAMTQYTISAPIYNSGNRVGIYKAILLINEKNADRKEITVNPGESKEVQFPLSLPEPGVYNISIGNSSISVNVKEYGPISLKASTNYSNRNISVFIGNKSDTYSPLIYSPIFQIPTIQKPEYNPSKKQREFYPFIITNICLHLKNNPVVAIPNPNSQSYIFIRLFSDVTDTGIRWQGDIELNDKLACNKPPAYYVDVKTMWDRTAITRHKRVQPFVQEPFFLVIDSHPFVYEYYVRRYYGDQLSINWQDSTVETKLADDADYASTW